MAKFQLQGLGVDFLKHVDRCKCLAYVIDLSANNVEEQMEVLKGELDHYKPGLSKRPCAILANKIDLEESLLNVETVQKLGVKDNMPVYFISGKMGKNLRTALIKLRELYDQQTNTECDKNQ